MPTFKWVGVDVEGNICKGQDQSISEHALQQFLAAKKIAIISAYPKTSWFDRKWSQHDTLAFFSHLFELLQAGLFLPDALSLMYLHEQKKHRKDIIEQLNYQVTSGISLSSALEMYPSSFNRLIISIVKAGEETGQLIEAIELIVTHISFNQSFAQRLRSAATMPAISFVFFGVVFGFILFGLLPKIATLFTQQHHQLPKITAVLLKVSNFASNKFLMLVAFTGLIGKIVGLKLLYHRYPAVIDRAITKLPLIGSWSQKRALVYFFKTLALLLEGNIPLVPALSLAQQAIPNRFLRDQLHNVIESVSHGSSLSQAMSQLPWGGETVTIVALGEQTGKLGPVISRTALWHEQRFNKALDSIAVYIQPTLILCMGLCIAGLIAAVYVPIISLAGAIKL